MRSGQYPAPWGGEVYRAEVRHLALEPPQQRPSLALAGLVVADHDLPVAERLRRDAQDRPLEHRRAAEGRDRDRDEGSHRRHVPTTFGLCLVRAEPEVELLERERAEALSGCHAATLRSAPARSACQAQGSSPSSSFAFARPETTRSS